MVRAVVLALVVLGLAHTAYSSGTPDSRIDPRAVNITLRDLPRGFQAAGSLLSVSTSDDLKYDTAGHSDLITIFAFPVAGGKAITATSTVSIFATVDQAAGLCCGKPGQTSWKNQNSIFKPSKVGDTGYSDQTGPDAAGLIADQITFRRGAAVVTVVLAGPAAGAAQGAQLIPHLVSRLAQSIDRRLQSAKPSSLSALVRAVYPSPPHNGILRPARSGLPLAVDAAILLSGKPNASRISLDATTTPGAACRISVDDSTGRALARFTPLKLTVPAGGIVAWSWPRPSWGSTGTASVDCEAPGKGGGAVVNYLASDRPAR